MDVDKLLLALDNEDNEKLMNLTLSKIKKIKFEILKELELSNDLLKDYMNKLKEYRYIDEMNELRYGAFIRWIPIKDLDNLYLTQGALLCEIKVDDNGIVLSCKNYAHKHFQLRMEECLIFQKLTNQEQVLLSALEHLSK
jgi:hypothetical protein